jgi:UPF0755 protein
VSRKRRPRRRAPVRRPLRVAGKAVLAALIVMIAASGWVVWTYSGPGPAARQGPATTVMLEHGSGVAQIARDLARAGVIRSSTLFIAAAKLSGAGRSLKAGEYDVPSHASMARILGDIRAGRVVRHLITVPEGWTSEMAADAVARSPVLIGQAEAPAEGAILPDTYQVERGEDRAAVLRRMTAAQDKVLAELWASRQPDLPFRTPEEAVALASIVEKETALPAERPRIAAVYINRLRAGMRLESDPTIIYGVSKGRPLGRGISRAELTTLTPYNTYLVAGLPPTPIANPGRASLAAVLNPPKTTELFFVANGGGGHVFSSTFQEHEKNVARWRAVERQHAAAEAGK